MGFGRRQDVPSLQECLGQSHSVILPEKGWSKWHRSCTARTGPFGSLHSRCMLCLETICAFSSLVDRQIPCSTRSPSLLSFSSYLSSFSTGWPTLDGVWAFTSGLTFLQLCL